MSESAARAGVTGTGAGSGDRSGPGPGPGPVTRPVAGAAGTAAETVTKAYSFVCLRCAHGWEQTYQIEHRADGSGRPFVTYHADGVEVPSPLARPVCGRCDGSLVRIMRAGQVSAVTAKPPAPPAPVSASEAKAKAPAPAASEAAAIPRPHRSVLRFLRRGPRGHGGSAAGTA